MENKKDLKELNTSFWFYNVLMTICLGLILYWYDWKLIVIFIIYTLSRNVSNNYAYKTKDSSIDDGIERPKTKPRSKFQEILEEMAKERSNNKSEK